MLKKTLDFGLFHTLNETSSSTFTPGIVIPRISSLLRTTPRTAVSFTIYRPIPSALVISPSEKLEWEDTLPPVRRRAV